jgi:hypothetical protein
MILDFSQYKKWMDCPRQWYNTYVAKVKPIPTRNQFDGPLTLGSLVHNGLEHLLVDRKIHVSEECIVDEKPTPQCLSDALHILTAYSQEMMNEPYVPSRIEESLMYKVSPELTMMAKVDEYFHLEKSLDLPRGNGEYLTLEPGWWLREHKTKGATISYESFNMRWTYDKQADFQTLCLSEHLQEPVNGVLINVIEKPINKPPKRKCRGCAQLLPFASYAPTPDNKFECSLCGYKQELKPLKPEQLLPKNPKFYRVYTRRSLQRLSRTIDEMVVVAERMERMRKDGIDAEPPRVTEGACSHMLFGPCTFMPLCITEDGNPIPALDHGKFEQGDTTKYMGLPARTNNEDSGADT